MAQMTEKCPHCGNVVEGKKIKTYTNKVTRQGAKTAVHMATSAGGMATGAAIGSAIMPGVGTVVGGALGFIGSAMFNQKVNESIDKVGDKIEDELIMMDYEFTCPNCGHSWKRNELEKDDEDEGLPEYKIRTVHLVINVISNELDVDADDITPNSDLEEDLGATDRNKKNILVELEKLLGTSSAKSFEDFTFVDDFIEEFIGESLWGEDVPPLNEDDEGFSYQNEYGRFKSFGDSYIKDEYSNMKIEDLSNMLTKEAELCTFPAISSNFYRLIAVVKLEYFYKEWLENHFSNYTGQTKQAELQRICLIEGIENIEKARELLGEDNTECVFVFLTLSMLKDFWVDECVDKKRYEQDYGTDAISFCDEKEAFMFSTDWLKRMYIKCYDAIISSLEETNEDTLSGAEQEYLNELKEILSDGEISPRERRLLDKIREQLNISEERAAELETSLSSPSLTPEEQEYLDEYKEIVAEGEISARDQRFLDKLKKANGISEERAKEIEALI